MRRDGFPGARASRPPGPEARHGRPAAGSQTCKRARRPRSQGAALPMVLPASRACERVRHAG